MPTDNSSANSISDRVAAVGEKASAEASHGMSKVSDATRAGKDAFDQSRFATASGLDTVAETLHDKADAFPGGERVSEFAHATADRVSRTADYVREHDVNRMINDVETLVKNNPGPALLVAAAFGFLVARALTRD